MKTLDEKTKTELAIFFHWLHMKEYGVKTFETGECWFNGQYLPVDEIVEQYQKETE